MLAEVLGVREGVTAVIGGGGKTTLLRTLGEELARSGARVILATSTKFRPFPGIKTVPSGEREIAEALGCAPLVCAAAPWGKSGKLAESPVPMARLAALADCVLVEADGSAGLPLKAHAPHEPVIPAESGRVILVLGASGFGRPIRETAHRPERYAALADTLRTDEDIDLTDRRRLEANLEEVAQLTGLPVADIRRLVNEVRNLRDQQLQVDDATMMRLVRQMDELTQRL